MARTVHELPAEQERIVNELKGQDSEAGSSQTAAGTAPQVQGTKAAKMAAISDARKKKEKRKNMQENTFEMNVGKVSFVVEAKNLERGKESAEEKLKT